MTDEELKYTCDIIRNSVTALEAGKMLGLMPGRDGRCKCFFHGGDHKNLKLYDGNKGYYCFVCHEFGDVIKLVWRYQQCTFIEAIEWLNDTFCLNLDLKKDNGYNRRRRAEAYARKLAKENHHGSHP